MKKTFFLVAMGLSTMLFAQTQITSLKPSFCKKPGLKINTEAFDAGLNSAYKPGAKMAKPGNVKSQAITVIQMGDGPNPLGSSGGCRTQLWAEPNLNTVVLVHRSFPGAMGDPTTPNNIGTGYLRYDISTDAGVSWAGVNLGTNFPLYKPLQTAMPSFSTARYPQGGIYNPIGNTDPNNAYVTFYAPSQTSANGAGSAGYGGWGGNVWGVYQLDDMYDPSGPTGTAPTKHELNSNRFIIPDGFAITKTGTTFAVDLGTEITAGATPSYIFHDSILISKGSWNTGTNDYDYTFSRLYCPVTVDAALNKNIGGNIRVAFADDGNTGYLVTQGHVDYVLESDTIYQFIIFKTTNAGTNWSAPINVSLNKLNTALLNAADVKCMSDGGFDAVVDINGNLHILATVTSHPAAPTTPSGPSQIYAGTKAWGIFDVYTTDGGTTWDGVKLANPETWQGMYGDQANAGSTTSPQIIEGNRLNASRTWNGDKLFFTWFDTDTNVTANQRAKNNWFQLTNITPDMHAAGFDIISGKWTSEKNITAGTDADASATFGFASYYVFGSTGTYTIPVGFAALNNNDPMQTSGHVIFKYIDGAMFADGDFTQGSTPIRLDVLTSAKELKKLDFTLSANYPNPFSGITTFSLSLEKTANVSIDVINTLGEKVLSTQSKSYTAGNHTLTVDASSFAPGVYFYTVKVGESAVTKKMTVK